MQTVYRLASYRFENRDRVGLVLGEKVVDLEKALQEVPRLEAASSAERVDVSSMSAVLRQWPALSTRIAAAAAYFQEETVRLSSVSPADLADVDLLAPVPHPGKIINVGLNFYDHAREMGISELPQGYQPNFFFKGERSSVIGPGMDIRVSSPTVDWEAELALVIGRTAANVSASDAMDCVAGFTCHNDVTDRGLMMKPDGSLDFFFGKAQDTFAPLGPFLVPAEIMPDLRSLRVRCLLNGELMQDYGLDQIIWGPAECISHISRHVTLNPGDIIGLGTGAGTGWAKGISIGPGEMSRLVDHLLRGGGRLLREGDRIAVEIEPIGRLENGVESK